MSKMNTIIHTKLDPSVSSNEDQKPYSYSLTGLRVDVDMDFLQICAEAHRSGKPLPKFCGELAHEYAGSYSELRFIAELMHDSTPKDRYMVPAYNKAGNCLIEFSLSSSDQYVPYHAHAGGW